MRVPSTQELADQNLAGLESALSQTSPLNEKAFLRVLAVVEALGHTGLYKLAAERARQNLAITATGEDLDLLGLEVQTPRKLATVAVLEVTLPAVTDVLIPAATGFIGAANGVRYASNATVSAIDGVATFLVTSETDGPEGNLQVGDTLTLISQIVGATVTATVAGVLVIGTEDEKDPVYKLRVMFAQRATTGGGNATDHKVWAEEVAGVVQAFPYAGKPPALGLQSYPGDRTVYIESDTSIDPDGLAPAGLLAEARVSLNYDLTGKSRAILGQTNDNLYVQSITRIPLAVTVAGLSAPAGTEGDVRTAIEAVLRVFLLGMTCYVEGVDLPQERNDLITALLLTGVVQEVLASTGSSANSVAFTLKGTAYAFYRLEPGELVKLGSVRYVP